MILLALFMGNTNEASENKSSQPPIAENKQTATNIKQKERNPSKNKKSRNTQPETKLATQRSPSSQTNKSSNGPKNDADQFWVWPPTSGWAIVYITTIYALFAFGQWWAIWFQGRRISRLERPWIMFRPSDPNLWPFCNPFDPNQPALTVNWNIINVGRSPAFLTRLVARMEIVGINATPPRLHRGTDFSNYILSPKTPPEDRHGTESRRPISQGQYNDLQNGTMRIWLYGIAEYRGIRRRRHHTHFCCLWFIENGVSNYDPVGPEGWTEYT